MSGSVSHFSRSLPRSGRSPWRLSDSWRGWKKFCTKQSCGRRSRARLPVGRAVSGRQWGLMMLRILVVEDNPLVAKFYRLALERAGGFQVTFSEDVEAILAQVAASAFDAMVLDVSLRNCRYQGCPVD